MTLRLFAAALILLAASATCVSAEQTTPQWLDSYSAGMQQAKQSGRRLLVYFHQDEIGSQQDQLCRR